MTRVIDTGKYQELLEAKQTELFQGLRRREDITIEKAPDAIDDLQLMALRELAISNLHRESRLLRGVKAALNRIEEGRYGVCLRCEEPISPKRLSAVPWAAYCVGCQEAIDGGEARGENREMESFDMEDAA